MKYKKELIKDSLILILCSITLFFIIKYNSNRFEYSTKFYFLNDKQEPLWAEIFYNKHKIGFLRYKTEYKQKFQNINIKIDLKFLYNDNVIEPQINVDIKADNKNNLVDFVLSIQDFYGTNFNIKGYKNKNSFIVNFLSEKFNFKNKNLKVVTLDFYKNILNQLLNNKKNIVVNKFNFFNMKTDNISYMLETKKNGFVVKPENGLFQNRIVFNKNKLIKEIIISNIKIVFNNNTIKTLRIKKYYNIDNNFFNNKIISSLKILGFLGDYIND